MVAQRLRRSALVVLFALSTAAAQSSAADHDEAPIEAIWRIQQLHFQFYSSSTSYACDSLRRKVASILQAVGARADIVVDAGCSGDHFVRGGLVSVTLAAPVPATPENVHRETTYDSRDELVSRLRKTRLPTSVDIQRFPALWQTVALTRDRRARIDRADCDLVMAMSRELFPRMAIELNTDNFSCPRSMSRVHPQVEVAALISAPTIPVAFAGGVRRGGTGGRNEPSATDFYKTRGALGQ